MVLTSPTQVNPNSQYDSDSAPNQNWNCGPTTVTNVLKFHKDRDFPIEATRNLATSQNGTGTTSGQRKIMMEKRGLASAVRYINATQVRQLLNGKRAFEISLLMSMIPLSIRKRPFAGSHSVMAESKGYRNGQRGIWVKNPDFHRSRGEPSRYFYPDKYWIPAFHALGKNWLGRTGGWAVVPDKDKVISTRVAYKKSCTTKAGLNARSGPSTRHSIVKTLPAGYRFTSIQLEKAGGAYPYSGGTRRDWLSFSLNGRLVWVARAYIKEG